MWFFLGLGTIILYAVALGGYNLLLHPLRRYPGPRLFAAYRLPYVIAGNTGDLPALLRKWHLQYGTVIRIAPDELAYETSTAWKIIYGAPKGIPALEKDPHFLTPPYPGMMPSIGNADNIQHARYRRLLSHAFSSQALMAQEALVLDHVNRLMECLRNAMDKKTRQDLVTWFMWATFDIVGDLAFGESFGCLDRCAWHPWTETVIAGFEAGMLISSVRRYVPLTLALRLVPRRMMEKRDAHFAFAKAKVAERMSRGPGERPDFLSYIMKHGSDDHDGPSIMPEHIQPNAAVIVLAGGHTTSTLLSSAVYLLLKRPDSMDRVVSEVRTAFPQDADISFAAISTKLPYMLAVLQESLRLYPPVATGPPRMTPAAGMVIDDGFVPGNMRVSVSHVAASRSLRNFHDPDSFRPERWLRGDEADAAFAQDDRAATQPFSLGPRNCLGKHVAHMEMRLLLAKLLWNFDLSLDPQCENWGEKKIYISWQRKPLLVHLKDRFANL